MKELLPDEKTTITTYNTVAKEWSTDHHTSGFWEEEMHRFRQLLPKGNIIEIGSGGGRDAKELCALGYGYVGVDVSGELLKIARANNPNLEFYKQTAYELNFPNQKFDGFWCAATLLHIPKTRINKALNSIGSVLNPGAVGFISIKDGQGEGLEIEQWNSHSNLKRLFSYWEKEEFEQVLKSNGYQVVDYIFRPDSQKTRWHCFFVKNTI